MADTIQEYRAPIDLGSVSDRASSAHVTAGRRIAMQYNEAGQAIDALGRDIGGAIHQIGKAYVEYQTHKEVSAGGLHASSILLSKTAEWNEMTKPGASDPNDPSVQPKFLGGLEKSLEDFRQSFSTEEGQKWADHRATAIRDHFQNVTTADMSTRAGIAVHQNAVQSINNYTAIVDKDPSALGMVQLLFNQDMKDLVSSSPNLKGVAAAKVLGEATQKGMEQIVNAAISGAIRKGTDGSEIADDPRFTPFINTAERRRMVSEFNQQQRMAKMEEREAKRFEKEQAQYKSDETVIAFRKRMGPGAEGQPPTREEFNEAIDNGSLTRRDLEHVLALQEHYNGKEPTDAKKSAANYRPLLDQIRDGDMKTLSPIWAAESRGDINKADSDRLQRAYRDMTTPEGSSLQKELGAFLKQAKPYIDKSVFGPDYGGGAIKFYEFERDVERKVEAYRKQGKDPHDLFDPSKPDYVGKKEVLDKYIPPMERDLKAVVERARQGTRPPISNFGGN